MKSKIYIASLAALTLAACSPEDYDSVNEAGLPVAQDAKAKVDVDDETNTVTLSLEGAGQYVMWYLPVDGKEITKKAIYSTSNPLTRIWASAGDYTVYYRVGNSNGLSQGMGQLSFTVKNSLTNYDEIYAKLCNKEWRIANSEAGHMGCGPAGTDGTEWWTAKADEKKAFGLYDDRITFTPDGTYTYNPGEGGTVFVNNACTTFAEHQTTPGEDYMVPVEKQETEYTISTEGESLYINFPAETFFPYIPCDKAYTGELKLRVESLTGSKIVLVYDNGEIAWRYILTSASLGFQGFTPGSDCNMWKNATLSYEFFYAPGWSQIADPEVESDGNNYTVSLPTATTEQWQAQVKMLTDMASTATAAYDFSMKVTSTTDVNGATIKLVKHGDDDTFYFVERVDLKAGQEVLFYKSGMEGMDIDKIDLVLDFGGAPDNTKINFYDICLQEHKCDGVEAPAEEEDKTIYTYDSESNIWKSAVDDKGEAGFTLETYHATGSGWTVVEHPTLSVDGGVYTVEIETSSEQQWQCQVKLKTVIAVDADVEYDFSCKMTAVKGIKGVTLKLVDSADDNNYLFLEQYDLSAGDVTQVKIPAKTMKVGAASSVTMVFDFGQTPENEKVEISEIILQKTAK